MRVTLKRLDHVNLRTADLDGMIAWYGRVLDMHPGPRPNFDVPGAWLYADGHPIVHLIEVSREPGSDPKDLKLEHFAISASNLSGLLASLEAEKVSPRLFHVADFGILQVNIADPDGNHIHIDFDSAEAEGLEI